MTRSVKINSAKITWQTDEHGLRIPISSDFGDVYFSKSNGLAESRYVFIDGNDLATSLQNLSDYQTFVIGEVGFGTGLNVLAIWQLWQKKKMRKTLFIGALQRNCVFFSSIDCIDSSISIVRLL